MAKDTKIPWADHTWNPWLGCHKVSAGCSNCYMYRGRGRYGNDPNVVVKSKTQFNMPLGLVEQDFVFTCSWSDFFIKEADQWREQAWSIIKQTPHLTYLILTKRPELVVERLPWDFDEEWHNVWIGVSVENQKEANRRLPILFNDIPAVRRFISCEPLLEPVNLEETHPSFRYLADWVIVGGESGPHQKDALSMRPMRMEWARNIRDLCIKYEIPFFFKQQADPEPGQRPYIIEKDGSRTEWFQRPDHVKVHKPAEQLKLF